MRFLLIAFFFTSFTAFQANANIALSKFRVFLDNSNRTDALQLRNTGSADVQYTAELGLMAMTEDGTLYPIEDDPHSATKLLRFSPKRGLLKPGSRQALRFAVRKPAGLEDGEYRAVLKLTSTILSSGVGSVNLNSKLAYNLPVIIRHGRVDANTELKKPRLVILDNIPHIELWQTREGNRSLFGNFLITDEDGNELGVLNNVATYRPLAKRKILIPLSAEATGSITITFKEIEKFGGNLVAISQLSIN